MPKFFFNKLLSCLSLFLLLNSSISPTKASSALAAWILNSNGVLELRTKSNSKLKAYFQKGGSVFGDRFWIDFPGELKAPRTIEGNGPIKEIRLGKPTKGKTRLVVEFSNNINLNPLNWKLVGTDQNRWKIKLLSLQKNSLKKIGEGHVGKSKSISLFLVNLTVTPLSDNNFFTRLETSSPTSASLSPPIPIAPGSGPP